ncbi:hypothetical protein BG004_003384 [Podila humilis]|nr:hypothetical protein BG004_003384 [Podila humilis]
MASLRPSSPAPSRMACNIQIETGRGGGGGGGGGGGSSSMSSSSKPLVHEEKKEKERDKPRSKTASKTPAKAPARPPSKGPEKKKPPVKRPKPAYTSSDEDVPMITFEQKKELSDAINNFEGDKLANVVQIIHSSMPHLRDNGGQEEIELDMDSLDPKTLYKLHQYVKKNTTVKRKRPPLPKKVKHQYSEEDANKKMAELERTLEKFEPSRRQGSQLGMVDAHSSSSSDSSSSSGSDSDDSGSSSD